MRPFPVCLVLVFAIRFSASGQTPATKRIDSLQSLLRKSPSVSEKGILYGQISWEYVNQEQYEPGWAYADSLKQVAEKTGVGKSLAEAQFYFGVISRHRGNYADALAHLHEAIKYYSADGDSASVARSLFHAGVVNFYLGKYEQSLATFYRIIGIHEKNNSYKGVAYTLNGIGVIYRNTRKFEDARNVLTKAIAIYDTIDAPEDKAIALNNLANVYIDMGLKKEALDQYRKALAIEKQLGQEQGMAFYLGNIGVVYNEMKHHDSALVYQLQAREIRERFPEKKYELTTILKQTGHTYMYLKENRTAERYLLRSLALAREIKALSVERDVCQYLATLYEAEGTFSKAYQFQKQFAVLQDSIMNVESTRQVNELQTKYETERKDKEITLLAQEKKIQEAEAKRQATLKEAFFWGSILIVLFAGLLVYVLRQRLVNQRAMSQKNEEIREANFRREVIDLEKKALQAQINPHFLFNCMNSINRMILEGENENAAHYLAKFSKLVRLILENAGNSTVSLQNELALLESYINLEQLRFKGRMEYRISVEDTIDKSSTYLPSMVLQPFVENAIWHGLMHKENGDKGLIEVSVKEQMGRLQCTIEDNGVGREKASELRERSVLKTKSMGMQITEERLRLLSEEQLISIVDLRGPAGQACGTRVEINIPITN